MFKRFGINKKEDDEEPTPQVIVDNKAVNNRKYSQEELFQALRGKLIHVDSPFQKSLLIKLFAM
jgi:hypothetical protein